METKPGVATRCFVYGFLALLLVAGVVHIEKWPITGFHLYSLIRKSSYGNTELVGVDREGHAEVVSLDDLPLGYHNTDLLLGDVPVAKLCAAWLHGFNEHDDAIVGLRVYRQTLNSRTGGPRDRKLRKECALAADGDGSAARAPTGASR